MALSLQRYIGYASPVLNHIVKERSKMEREISVIAITAENSLPENVIVNILSWLPVKVLLQLKSVCKSWYSIISNPAFVSLHLKNYYSKINDNNDCLLVQYYVSHAELQLYELLLDDTPRVVAGEILYKMPLYASFVCGPCDGIFYLFHYDGGKRALWNPAINEVKYLPQIITKPDLPSHLTYRSHEVYGFGYDQATEDYKVVVIKGYRHTSYDEKDDVTHPSSVLVYSLRTNSWRYWGDLAQNYELYQSKCYIVINGCFYWLGSNVLFENSEFIISFDMGSDVIQEIQLPNYDLPANETLAMYDDCLAFLAVHGNEKRFEIWTWSGGLWTKKFALGYIPDVQRPVGHWKKKNVILECNGNRLVYGKRLVLCDPATEEIKDLEFGRLTLCQGIFVYRESLLSVKDNNEANQTDTHLNSVNINKVLMNEEFEGWEECSSYDVDLLFSGGIDY